MRFIAKLVSLSVTIFALLLLYFTNNLRVHNWTGSIEFVHKKLNIDWTTQIDAIPPYAVETFPLFLSVGNGSLSFCLIKKSMNTVNERFLRSLQFAKNEGVTLIKPSTLATFYAQDIVGKRHYVAMVRDPLERFLSGYMHFCCDIKRAPNDSGPCPSFCLPRRLGGNTNCITSCPSKNVSCFLAQMNEFMRRADNEVAMQDWFTHNHFGPQNFQCHFNRLLSRFNVIKYVGRNYTQLLTTYADLGYITQESIGRYNSSLLGSSVSWATNDYGEMKNQILMSLFSSRENMKNFLEIFYWDYRLFGFAIPREMVLAFSIPSIQ